MQAVGRRTPQSGDTLIEVLVAIAVFGVVIVGAFSLMNRGIAQMYDSMEKSEVRLLLNRQIEALTYARDEYNRSSAGSLLTTTYDQAAMRTWQAVRGQHSVESIPDVTGGCSTPEHAFFITTDETGALALTNHITTAIADEFPSPGNGIWVQKIDSDTTTPQPYKDFYIRACWMQNTNSMTQVLSSVVRLYDVD